MMILGPISYLDCLVFCAFLAPQLIIEIGILETAKVVIQALPFLVLRLPASFLYERYLLRPKDQSAFARQATPFADFVIRCVRFAFVNLSPAVGRVFFGRNVVLPWLRWRMLRHGYLKSPIYWREYSHKRFKGIWAIDDPSKQANIIIYYVHGGGFSMGSTYFYLEFLLSWLSLLKAAGFANPVVFGLDYTLVPDACFPKQLEEVVAGYEHVLGMAGDASRVCVAGDSAGGTLVLSLLLHLAKPNLTEIGSGFLGGSRHLDKPGMSVLISPWPTLVSPLHKNNRSDFLDVDVLQRYASQYVGGLDLVADPLASPGDCRDLVWWREAGPSRAMFITYGNQEVFAPEIEKLERLLRKAGMPVSVHREEPGIHAWPILLLFFGGSRESREDRLRGLKLIVSEIKTYIQ